MGEVILLPLLVTLPSVACFYSKSKQTKEEKHSTIQSMEGLLTRGFVDLFCRKTNIGILCPYMKVTLIF